MPIFRSRLLVVSAALVFFVPILVETGHTPSVNFEAYLGAVTCGWLILLAVIKEKLEIEVLFVCGLLGLYLVDIFLKLEANLFDFLVYTVTPLMLFAFGSRILELCFENEKPNATTKLS